SAKRHTVPRDLTPGRVSQSLGGDGMSKYLLIESRDPFESHEVSYFYDLAASLTAEGEVTLFLVQNGVLPARRCGESRRLTGLAAAGVGGRADDFSRGGRGIRPDRLAPGVVPAPLDLVIEELAKGHRALWH